MILSRAWRLTAALLLTLALWACVGAHRQMFGLGPSPAAAATLLPNGKQTFVDANGVPLAGGTVSFYIPNTLTLKTTWSDPGQTTPNANPLTLDSAGRAIIYGSGTYRQIVRDQFGTLIWDQLTADTSSPGIAVGGTSTGTGNSQVVTATTFTATNGQIITFIAGFTNTGATTLNAGTGPIPVDKDTSFGPVPLTGGEIVAANQVMVVYDSVGGVFHMVATPPTGENAPGTATITPTVLSTNTDNWNPTGLQGAAVIRVAASANINLNGIVAQPAGTVITLENIGGFSIAVLPGQTSSTAANRFGIPRQELLQPGQALRLIYDGPLANWVLNQATPSVLLPSSVKRQTVASGPSTSGVPNFLPATSVSLTLTMQNVAPTSPLQITGAFGFSLSGSIDYWCQVIGNQSWTLPANNTSYLYETINTDGSCTPNNTLLQPIYQWGGSISVTNGQYTFDYQHYQMWLGNGATAAQVATVFVGEAVTNAGTVTSTAAYAYNGHFESAPGTPPACPASGQVNDNMGTSQATKHVSIHLTNTVANAGYSPGAVVVDQGVLTATSAGVFAPVALASPGRLTSFVQCGAVAGNYVLIAAGSGTATGITNVDWTQVLVVDRIF